MKRTGLRLLSLCATSLLVGQIHAAEVQTFIVAKGQQLHQTNAASALVFTNEDANRFVANVAVNPTNTISGISLLLPNAKTRALTNSDDVFELEGGFTNKAQLDAAFGSGNYTLTIKSLAEGTNKQVVVLSANNYPGAPHVANWSDLQEIEADQPLTISWDGFATGTTNDMVTLSIDDFDGEPIANTPALLDPNALTGTSFSTLIPAETLDWNTNYQARLLFVKRTGNYTNALLHAKGLSGYYRETKFNLVTLPEPPSHGRIQFSTRTFSAPESAGTAALVVTRSGDEGTVTVGFTTSDGTAHDGVDYGALTTTLTFADHESVKIVPLALVKNSLLDGSLTVNLALAHPTDGAILGSRSNAVLTILDNEVAKAGKLQFEVRSNSVSELIRVANISVKRVSGSTGPVSVDFATEDGTGHAGVAYVATNGTLTFAAGQTSRIIPVQIINDSLFETNRSFYVNLTSTGGGAALGSNTTTIVTIRNDDVAGQVALKSATLSANENATNFVVTVVRTGGKAGGVTVDFATQDGTALANLDYFPTNGTLTFGSNEMTKTFLVGINNDTLAELNETLTVHLSQPGGGASLGTISNATLTIVDDESSLSLASANVEISEGSTNLAFVVTRSGALLTSVSVDFATINGSAISTNDYRGTNGTLSFAPNATSKTIRVPIVNNTFVDASRSFNFRLSNLQGGVLPGAFTNTLVTITNNDTAGTIQFSAATYSSTEAAGNAAITITRTGGQASAVTVHFATGGGSATPGVRYTAVATNLTFNAGETNKIVLIPMKQDGVTETNQTVILTLTSFGGGATPGATTIATLTVADAPDPNAIPEAGPVFFKASVNGSTVSGLGLQVQTFSDLSGLGANSLLNVTGSHLALPVTSISLLNVVANGTGSVALPSSTANGVITYTFTSGFVPTITTSADTGGGGTVKIDVLNKSTRIITGRFDVITVNSVGGATYHLVGSFRIHY